MVKLPFWSVFSLCQYDVFASVSCLGMVKSMFSNLSHVAKEMWSG